MPLSKPLHIFLDCLGVFCCIALVRWGLVAAFGVDLPWWDQWDGAGAAVVLPAADNALDWHHILLPHNEHRIVFTRLMTSVLFALNGGWSPLLEAFAASLIPATSGALLCLYASILYGRQGLSLCTLTLILCFALPLATENYLYGFQSQFYFVVLFTAGALFLASDERWHPLRVGGALVLSTMSALSMASGSLTFGAVAAIWLLMAVESPSHRVMWLISGLLAGVSLVFAVKYVVVPVPDHAFLRAGGVGEFFTAFARYLAWPGKMGVLLLWGPAVVAWLGFVLAGRGRSRGVRFPLAILLWVGLVCASGALLRGAGGTGPADRYHDFLCLAFVAGGCLAQAASVAVQPRVVHWAAIYQATLVAVLLQVGLPGFGRLASDSERLQTCADNLRSATRIGGERGRDHLRRSTLADDLPHPSPDLIWSFLTHPQAHHMLPGAVRPDLLGLAPSAPGAEKPSYPSVPKPTAGVEFGTYVGGDQWTGEIDVGLLPTNSRHLQFEVAGYLEPGILELQVEDLPSGTVSLVQSPVPLGAGEAWRKSIHTVTPGTTAVRVTLRDTSTGSGGWLSLGSIRNLTAFEYWRNHVGTFATWCLMIGTIPLLTSIGVSVPSNTTGDRVPTLHDTPSRTDRIQPTL